MLEKVRRDRRRTLMLLLSSLLLVVVAAEVVVVLIVAIQQQLLLLLSLVVLINICPVLQDTRAGSELLWTAVKNRSLIISAWHFQDLKRHL